MFLFLIILALSLIFPLFHLYVSKKGMAPFRVVEVFFLYQLVFNIGLLGFLSFFGLTFMPETAAAYNEWPTCPFQQEMANVNLGFAVLGLLCIWLRGYFWTATAIGASIWLFGDGINHLVDSLYNHNYSPGNTGILVYSDLGIPVILMVLLFFYHKLGKTVSFQRKKNGARH